MFGAGGCLRVQLRVVPALVQHMHTPMAHEEELPLREEACLGGFPMQVSVAMQGPPTIGAVVAGGRKKEALDRMEVEAVLS